jgi:hypothetical protein
VILFSITEDKVRERFHLQENELEKNLIRAALQLVLQPKNSTVLVKNKVRSTVFISFTGQTSNLLWLKNEVHSFASFKKCEFLSLNVALVVFSTFGRKCAVAYHFLLLLRLHNIFWKCFQRSKKGTHLDLLDIFVLPVNISISLNF